MRGHVYRVLLVAVWLCVWESSRVVLFARAFDDCVLNPSSTLWLLPFTLLQQSRELTHADAPIPELCGKGLEGGAVHGGGRSKQPCTCYGTVVLEEEDGGRGGGETHHGSSTEAGNRLVTLHPGRMVVGRLRAGLHNSKLQTLACEHAARFMMLLRRVAASGAGRLQGDALCGGGGGVGLSCSFSGCSGRRRLGGGEP